MKTKRLKIDYRPNSVQAGRDGKAWQVKEVVNSTEYNPGQWLDKAEVNALCKAAQWEVKLTGGE